MDALKIIREMRKGKAAASVVKKKKKRDSITSTTRTDQLQLPTEPATLTLSTASMAPLYSISTVIYINEALSVAAAAVLLQFVDHSAASIRPWVQLRNRSVIAWGGRVGPRGFEDAEDLPPFLSVLVDALVQAGLFPPQCRPNHVLINEYNSGEGIMPHTDGVAYYPCTATVSLGSAALMRFHERGPGARILHELVLRPGSLVLFRDAAYVDLLHSISDDAVDVVGRLAPCLNLLEAGVEAGDELPRGRRVSLTIRHVPTRETV